MSKMLPQHVMDEAEAFDGAEAAVARLAEIYAKGRDFLGRHFERFAGGAENLEKADARYPAIWIEVAPGADHERGGLSYGAVPEAGAYSAVLTNPELFHGYYLEQLQLLLDNHGGPLWVGISRRQIPLTFALETLTADLRHQQVADLGRFFHLPDLAEIDDDMANGIYRHPAGAPKPLSLFSAERVDYSLNRLSHYSGTSPEHFQRFVLFTNYQRYVDEFVEFGIGEIENGDSFRAFVEPGNAVHVNPRLSATPSSGTGAKKPPQMPAYHLVKDGHMGVTLVNIGVGPSNAKTITDHVAVLRPHCWLMVGHCGGLRRTQRLGDYVLAHAYARLDHVLDHDLPLEIPIPAIAEVQLALTAAVAKVTGQDGKQLKQHLRTGTVVSTDDRDWELRYDELSTFFNQSRVIAVDMESATISANGFRLRVPYGTLLCVSNKPLHGEIKLPGMANAFYTERVSQHLRICLAALDTMRESVGHQALHSRKLRSFDEPPFR